jgi:probable phosphoglycerate mutase
MANQIYLLRHGETTWSLTGQHTGRTDLPLTENGELRASRLRGRLQGIKFNHVLTSPLLRARRTCELAGFGAVARVEPELQEWDYGAYEGRTTADIRLQRPGWDVFRDGCPGGESTEAIGARADRMAQVLLDLDGTVAVFSHGQFLRVLAMRWIGLPVGEGRHFALDTASISILGYEHETPAITLWNAGSKAVFTLSGTAAPAP